MAKCPICNAGARPRAENPAFPFCSARCKTIDLGKWLSEDYRIPVSDAEPEELEAAASSSDGGSKSPGDMRH
jgi:endogenous inhibitor of DNA gyrase (YacG/DUF329 family)